MNLITSITGKEILDSRGNPTVLAEVEVDKPHALRFSDSVSLTLSCNKTG